MAFGNVASDRADRLAQSHCFDPIYLEILHWHYQSHFEGRVATTDEDMTMACDIVIGDDDLDKGLGVAVKLRHEKFRRYRDFGLRSKADDGYLSEWDKVMKGRADQLLYCFQNDEGEIVWWYLIDLAVLRRAQHMKWADCKLPTKYEDPSNDIYLKLVSLDSIGPRYNHLLIAEGPYPLPFREDECMSL